MKRIISIILGVLLTASLSSCAFPLRDGESEYLTEGPEEQGGSDAPTADPVETVPAEDGGSETGEGGEVAGAERFSAIYTGIEDRDASAENMRFVFEAGGEKTAYPLAGAGTSFSLANLLVEGGEYDVTVEDGVVTELSAPKYGETADAPPVSGEAGVRTLTNLIKTALSPVGRTLYVYGGGWNWQDDGSSREACTPGLCPLWTEYFDRADAGYDYEGWTYPSRGYNEYHYAGLDCSGYIGWCVYSTLNAIGGGEGFVAPSTGFAKNLEDKGLGTCAAGAPLPAAGDYGPGDIVSIRGHVFMILGVCSDGSAVIVHSTVTTSRTGYKGGGVQISAVGYSKDCEAYAIADRFMAENYPGWNERYETDLKDPSVYFPGEEGSRFTWSEDVLSDPDGIRPMSPDRVLAAVAG